MKRLRRYATRARSRIRLSDSLRLMGRVSQELVTELARLNTARLGNDVLSQLSRHGRAQMVKAALAKHHDGITRCC